ncbi:helix-turn-helix domain-containing protein [Acidomonas methanolica]|uniref:Transcriptional regulator XRE n=1 Tax=Acidomonas methanolica NBRC 104435 TaxID=1231351 RepID=A0A023D9E2_ACIMT|nr:helix-turn-helix transcriptional regulator [Acidomonas methanolica]TCS21304.1 Xre family transcriptional regulator [Acidomonas methanolica]GAJ30743.1 transcriptional regulator XRE [Acidomonas methanolica NBRC 104435]GBQ49260.1 putative transcriptional regulator [Acidomonas methanolica]GEL00470.1 hypothetical protein AME01nite_29680 [Acidomonas methanolica NBRC 104435]
MANKTFPSPVQVKAARALIAWTQAQLADEAGVAVSTVADFERGGRTPVANNAQAITSALERQGIRFTEGGAVTGSTTRRPTSFVGAGHVLRWITAEDLSQWAVRRDGPAALPELISRLLVVSCGPMAIRFPSDESIQHAGWDGICVATIATQFVPEGQSVWELGAQRQKIAHKAEEDYAKRSVKPLGVVPAETCYIFVTPHRWPKKDEWAAAKRAEGVWRDVRVIDGDMLVHWLELHAGVAEWLAVRMGRRPQGVRSVTDAFEEWSLATKFPLTCDIVKADRDEEATQILRWLYAEPSVLSVQTEAVDEAIAFLYAAIEPLPERERLYWLSRTLVADSEAAARELAGLNAKLVIILSGGDPGLAARLSREGHHVFVAFGSDVGTPTTVIRLPRAWRHTIEVALTDAGLPEQEAKKYAQAAGRSLVILRRLMPKSPVRQPDWAKPPVSRALMGAVLAGAWDRDNPLDRAILSRLTGLDYDALEVGMVPFAAALDGPMRRSGSVWKLASLRDSWFLLADQITPALMDLFIAVFRETLSAADPAYDDPEQRWRLDRSAPKQVSSNLRRGLGEAMIALGVYPERAEGIPNAASLASHAVETLLTHADGRGWWALSRDFRRLAEAAPDAFLEAIDKALKLGPSPLKPLFRSDEGLLGPSEYLSDLMWALEILCWSTDYVGRAAMILARLADVDPGGRMQNRPFESLTRIFLPWHPETYASATERIQLLDQIVRKWPNVGWRLLCSLASREQGVVFPSAKPSWRDFSTNEPEPVTYGELYAMYRAIGDRLLAAAGNEPSHWENLIGYWSNFEPEWQARAVQKLRAAVAIFDADAQVAFRDMLRAFIAKHEGFSDADWAMKGDQLKPLKEIFDFLKPKCAKEEFAWLFNDGYVDHSPNLSWDEHQARRERKQISAAEAIIAESSLEEVVDFALSIRQPSVFGFAAASSEIVEEHKNALLKEGFQRGLANAEQFSRGLLSGLLKLHGEEPMYARFRSAIDAHRPLHELLAIAFILPPEISTWSLVAEAGVDVEHRYWSGLNSLAIPETASLDFVIDKLLNVNRGKAALQFIAGKVRIPVSSPLVLKVLRHPSTVGTSGNTADEDNNGMISWYTGKMFERLDHADDFDKSELVLLEWTYFQALRHSERPPRSLHKALAEDPEFFLFLFKTLYSSTNENEPELTSDERERANIIASQAFHVLNDWKRVPGSDDDGKIDAPKLAAWVAAVRADCAASGRVQIGDEKIGEILSATARVKDKPWPPEAICDIIEDVANDDLERGFIIGLFNRRGVTTRMPTDGGAQERVLARRYRDDAKAHALLWPRTRALLERIASQYEADAKFEDQTAEQGDW